MFEREKITLAVGDRIRFTKNVKHREQKFLNNELRTMVSVDDGKIIFNKGEIVRTRAALHLDQGIAVTSHASQAKTVDQVIASGGRLKFSKFQFKTAVTAPAQVSESLERTAHTTMRNFYVLPLR